MAAELPEDWPEPPKPDIADEWAWLWRAWWRLHADRPYNGGGFGPPIPQRIAWRSVVEWCEFHGYAGEDVAFMDACFSQLDTVFFEHHAAAVKAASAK